MSSIKEVAQKAGVSVSSVSLAYHKPNQLSSETRTKILKIANELGYKPNVNKINSSFKTIAIAVPLRDTQQTQVPLVSILTEMLLLKNFGSIVIEYESVEILNQRIRSLKNDPNIKGLIIICNESERMVFQKISIPTVITSPHTIANPSVNIGASVSEVLATSLGKYYDNGYRLTGTVIEKAFLSHDYVKKVGTDLYTVFKQISDLDFQIEDLMCVLEGDDKDFDRIQKFYNDLKPQLWLFIGVHGLNIAQSIFDFPLDGVILREENAPCSIKSQNNIITIVRPLSKIATQTIKMLFELINSTENTSNKQIQIMIN